MATGTKTIEFNPLDTPARDLPRGMMFTVCDVLDAYGLHVKDESLRGQGMVSVMVALTRLIDEIPEHLGGRLLPDGTVLGDLPAESVGGISTGDKTP